MMVSGGIDCGKEGYFELFIRSEWPLAVGDSNVNGFAASYDMNKRTFLKKATALGIGSMVIFKALSKMVDAVSNVPAEVVAEDDDL